MKLASEGSKVLVVDGRDSPGGMTRSQAFEDGFRSSPHANILFYQGFAAARRHWDPELHGLKTHWPEAQAGVAFADGRPPIVLHRLDRMAKTVRSIGRYSRRDARTFETLLKGARRLADFAGEAPYHRLDEDRFERQVVLTTEAFRSLGVERGACLETVVGLIDRLFETPELRLFLYHLASELGVPLTVGGGALAFLSQVSPSLGRWRIPDGTMQAVAEALATAAVSVGAEFKWNAPVSAAWMEGRRCVGVRLADGAAIRARQGVVFATSLAAALELMDDARSEADYARLAVLRRSQQGRFARGTFCLAHAPSYRSSKHDEDIDRCLHTLVGFDTPQDYLRHVGGLELGIPPVPAGALRVSSHWDHSLAPPGAQVATLDAAFPPASTFDPEDWDGIEAGYLEAFVDVWRDHLVNFEGMLRGQPAFAFADDYDRRLPLRQDDDQYRASTDGVYFAGAGVFPGGGVHGGCAINAFEALARDLRQASTI